MGGSGVLPTEGRPLSGTGIVTLFTGIFVNSLGYQVYIHRVVGWGVVKLKYFLNRGAVRVSAETSAERKETHS